MVRAKSCMPEPSPQNGLWLNFASFWKSFWIDFGMLSGSTWHPKRGILVVRFWHPVSLLCCFNYLLASSGEELGWFSLSLVFFKCSK